MNIQMVDLKGQYQQIKAEVDAAIFEVLNSTAFINGPAVSHFAREIASYNKVAHAIPCANGHALPIYGLDPRPSR